MDATDNKNISMKELCKFLTQCKEGKEKCPKCGSPLSIMEVSTYDPFEAMGKGAYVYGMNEPYLFAEIKCSSCGFSNKFNTLWCLKGYDGSEKKIYKVCHAVGGVPEKPDYDYEDISEIEAYSEAEAIKKYDDIHGECYWATVIYKEELYQ